MKCMHIKEGGDQCGANAMPDGYCYLHSPNVSDEERFDSQSRGGLNKSITLSAALPVITIEKPQDAVDLLVDTIGRVRAGQMDIRIANSTGYLVNILLKAYETAALSSRLETVERVILERRLKR